MRRTELLLLLGVRQTEEQKIATSVGREAERNQNTRREAEKNLWEKADQSVLQQGREKKIINLQEKKKIQNKEDKSSSHTMSNSVLEECFFLGGVFHSIENPYI